MAVSFTIQETTLIDDILIMIMTKMTNYSLVVLLLLLLLLLSSKKGFVSGRRRSSFVSKQQQQHQQQHQPTFGLSSTVSLAAISSGPLCIRQQQYSRSLSQWQDLRGGSIAVDQDEESSNQEEQEEEEESDEEESDEEELEESKPQTQAQQLSKEPIAITIQTAVGNALVDQVLELTVQRGRTIASIKESIRRQLPGKPPVACMQLVVDGQALADHVTLVDLLDDEEEDDDDDDDDQADNSEERASALTRRRSEYNPAKTPTGRFKSIIGTNDKAIRMLLWIML